MTATATKEGRQEAIEILLTENDVMLYGLWERWQDEREYEDWKDYDAHIRANLKHVPEGYTITKTTSRPFAVFLSGPEGEFKVYMTATTFGWAFRKTVRA